jgi:hypothetical protein
MIGKRLVMATDSGGRVISRGVVNSETMDY